MSEYWTEERLANSKVAKKIDGRWRIDNSYVIDHNQTCEFVFKRGRYTGVKCDRHVLFGYDVCNGHWSKR